MDGSEATTQGLAKGELYKEAKCYEKNCITTEQGITRWRKDKQKMPGFFAGRTLLAPHFHVSKDKLNWWL